MSQQLPLFSIVIPTYARPERLSSCLQAIAKLEYPRDRFEVIVVDDGSNPPVKLIVDPFQEQLNLTLIRQPNSGPAKARNNGAGQARGQFLVFTDDDCAPAPDWLQVLEAHVIQSPNCLIGGRTLNALSHNVFSTASQVLIDYLYTYYNADSQQSNFFASNNLAIPTNHFHAIGGFDTSFPLAAGEDREFCDRWLHQGYSMIFVPEVKVYHAHQLTFASFWRQHFNYGRGAFYFHKARSQRNLEPIKVEPLWFYLHLLIYPFSQTPGTRGILVSALFLVSQVANVAGFFWERSQRLSEARSLGTT